MNFHLDAAIWIGGLTLIWTVCLWIDSKGNR